MTTGTKAYVEHHTAQVTFETEPKAQRCIADEGLDLFGAWEDEDYPLEFWIACEAHDDGHEVAVVVKRI